MGFNPYIFVPLVMAFIVAFIGAGLMLRTCTGIGKEEATDIVKVPNVSSSVHIREATLKDGTRCAVLIGYKKGGITCDWK